MGKTIARSVAAAHAMAERMASRYPRCSAIQRLAAPATSASFAKATDSPRGEKPSKLTPIRTISPGTPTR